MRSAIGCAALGVLLLLVAGTFDAEPLYVTGAALLLLGGGSAAWIWTGAWGAAIHRTVGKRSVSEEEPLTVRIEATAGRLPLPPGWIDEPLLPQPMPVSSGRRRARVRVEVTFGRRGRRGGGPGGARCGRGGRRVRPPPALVWRDPFGLAQRVVACAHADEVLVLPRIMPVNATSAGSEAQPAHARAVLIAAAESEIDGVRPYREGSPASRIYWPSVARGAGLMERKLVSEADSRPLVVLDPRAPQTPEALDAAVRATGSLCVHFAGRTGCALLLPGDRRATIVEADLQAFPAAHARLALMDDRMGPALVAAQNRRGLVVFVSARIVDRVPRGLGRTPGGCLLVIPGEIAQRRGVLEVAGCHGYVGARTGSGAAMAAVAGSA